MAEISANEAPIRGGVKQEVSPADIIDHQGYGRWDGSGHQTDEVPTDQATGPGPWQRVLDPGIFSCVGNQNL